MHSIMLLRLKHLLKGYDFIIGFDNPPTIEYYNNVQSGDLGGYDAVAIDGFPKK